jgi:hypothetical protein
MPALSNPRHERFALAIFAGLSGKTRIERAQSTAYRIAYPNCAKGHSAEVAASRLMRRVEPIMARVRELQAVLADQTGETRDKCITELNELKREAQAQKAYGPAVSAVMGKAKILNFITDGTETKPQDYASAQSMQDIGRMLLQSIGFKEPDDVSIQAAIELNDTFVDGLQAIYQRAQSLTLERA